MTEEISFPVNLDDASDEEVLAVERHCRHALATPFAIEHGLDIGEAKLALATLAEYARAAREARTCRLAGKVQRAMVIERVNEDRYQALPEVLRW